MNKIRKVLVNDRGSKRVMSYQEFVDKYSPNYDPYFEICFIQGNTVSNFEILAFDTEGLMYNVQENMYYYLVSQQVIPHTYPHIIPSYEQAVDFIKGEAKKLEGKTVLHWNDGNKQYRKDIGFSTSWTMEEYDKLNIDKEEENE